LFSVKNPFKPITLLKWEAQTKFLSLKETGAKQTRKQDGKMPFLMQAIGRNRQTKAEKTRSYICIPETGSDRGRHKESIFSFNSILLIELPESDSITPVVTFSERRGRQGSFETGGRR
jgi:hypothetical protein